MGRAVLLEGDQKPDRERVTERKRGRECVRDTDTDTDIDTDIDIDTDTDTDIDTGTNTDTDTDTEHTKGCSETRM